MFEKLTPEETARVRAHYEKAGKAGVTAMLARASGMNWTALESELKGNLDETDLSEVEVLALRGILNLVERDYAQRGVSLNTLVELQPGHEPMASIAALSPLVTGVKLGR